MNLTEFKTHLQNHPQAALRFMLPDGDVIPAHAHITEAGRVDKNFIDCGGTTRTLSYCSLQAWVADDVEHRLLPDKLAMILAMAAPLFRAEDLEVEVEYEDCSISQYPVLSAEFGAGTLSFRLGSKHTDCLAKDVCLPSNAGRTGECC